MKSLKTLLSTAICILLVSCGSFKSKRVDVEEADKKASNITDEWIDKDTELAVNDILNQIKKHRGFRKYLSKHRGTPKLFIGEVQNQTSNPYFPIGDLNDELLNEFSASGDYVLIDAAKREDILKEIQYQNDGMVDAKEVKSIGKQAGADLIIYGNVRMKPKTRDGKTIKEYSVNLRMTDIQRAVEVLRVRAKVKKYSDQSKFGW